MSTLTKGYHHGDLRAALLAAATESLESGEPLSMRAVARRVGVSAAAPYRHFADREALDAAVAVSGFTDLREELDHALSNAPAATSAEDVITALGVAYVAFALRRPAVFRLMFGNECDQENSERVQAAAQLHDVLTRAVAQTLPDAPAPALPLALWSLAHGLAFLHLDGKFRPDPAAEVAARVRSSVAAIFTLPARATTPTFVSTQESPS